VAPPQALKKESRFLPLSKREHKKATEKKKMVSKKNPKKDGKTVKPELGKLKNHSL